MTKPLLLSKLPPGLGQGLRWRPAFRPPELIKADHEQSNNMNFKVVFQEAGEGVAS